LRQNIEKWEEMMTKLMLLISVALLSMAFAMPAEAKKKKPKPKRATYASARIIALDPTREAVYVRYELLNLFWSPRIEPPLRRGIYGVTPYAGLNAWIAHKVATACSPCELPEQAKIKYCNYWIEDQLNDEKRRVFRIPPDGWCYPMKAKEG
jgi:hypothetical protein